MKETFAERYVKKEDYYAVKNAAEHAILCLYNYRHGGHIFCVKWFWDWRCQNCKYADDVLKKWEARP